MWIKRSTQSQAAAAQTGWQLPSGKRGLLIFILVGALSLAGAQMASSGLMDNSLSDEGLVAAVESTGMDIDLSELTPAEISALALTVTGQPVGDAAATLMEDEQPPVLALSQVGQ